MWTRSRLSCRRHGALPGATESVLNAVSSHHAADQRTGSSLSERMHPDSCQPMPASALDVQQQHNIAVARWRTRGKVLRACASAPDESSSSRSTAASSMCSTSNTVSLVIFTPASSSHRNVPGRVAPLCRHTEAGASARTSGSPLGVRTTQHGKTVSTLIGLHSSSSSKRKAPGRVASRGAAGARRRWRPRGCLTAVCSARSSLHQLHVVPPGCSSSTGLLRVWLWTQSTLRRVRVIYSLGMTSTLDGSDLEAPIAHPQ